VLGQQTLVKDQIPLDGTSLALVDAAPIDSDHPDPKRRCPAQVVKEDPNLKPAMMIIRIRAPKFIGALMKAVAENTFDFEG
jgi:hypothetical protein